MTRGLLGRLPHDPGVLARAPKFGVALGLTAPAKLDRSSVAYVPAMDGNDTLSCCTAAALAHCAGAAAAVHGYSVLIPADKVIAFYGQSTGYNGSPATDQGGQIAAVLANQAKFGFDIGDQAPLVGAWGTFDPQDLNLMRVAMAEGGSVNLGVDLSLSDQSQDVWTANPPASAGDPTPGSWGPHDLMAFDYQGTEPTDLVRLGTWDYWQLATWGWIAAHTVEAHAVVWKRFGAASPLIDYDTLLADNALFSDWLLQA